MITRTVMLSLLSCFLVIGGCSEPPEPPIPDSETQSDSQTSSIDTTTSHTWGTATYGFYTDTTVPLLIHREPGRIIFVYDKSLYCQVNDQEPLSLYQWSDPAVVRLYRVDHHFLLGDQNVMGRTDWQVLDLSPPGGSPHVTSLTTSLHIQDIIRTRTSQSFPNLLLITALTNNSFVEVIYDSHHTQFFEVHRSTGAVPRMYYPCMCEFDNTTTHTLDQYTLISLEDELGTLLYNVNEQTFERYYSLWHSDFRKLDDSQGKQLVAGQFTDSEGAKILTLHDPALSRVAPFDPRLWEPGWEILLDGHFYRIHPTSIEVMTVCSGSWMHHEVLTEHKFLSRDGFMLHYEEGFGLWLESLIDCSDMGCHVNDDLLVANLIHPVATGTVNWTDQTEPPSTTVLLFPPIKTPEDPDVLDIERPLEEQQVHYWYTTIEVRNFHGQWYGLMGQSLYALTSGAEPTLLADLPLSVAVIGSHNYRCTTARDFTYRDGLWFIADTFGDRIIKLGAAFSVISSYAAHLPFQLEWTPAGHLQVHALTQTVTLDMDLNLIATAPTPYVSATNARSIDIYERQVHVDYSTGLTWLLADETLWQYDRRNKTVRRAYVGDSYSGSVIVPWRDVVVVLFYDRALIFERGGQWRRTISFPPQDDWHGDFPPIGIGSGSWHLHSPTGKLYLVQESQLLEIDIPGNSVTSVMTLTNPGTQLSHEGKLYLSNAIWTRGPYGELIVVDMETGDVSLFYTPRPFVHMRIQDNQFLQVWSPWPDDTYEMYGLTDFNSD